MKEETKKVPAIRFKGFTDPWEQRKLNFYISTSIEKNINGVYSKADVLSVSGEVGIVNQLKFQGRSFAGASVLNYGIVKTGDIVYTKSPLKLNPYGIIKTNKGKTGIVSTLYAVYHPNALADSDFIQSYFEQNARVNKYLHPLVNKGAKNDMKVSADNALKGYVQFPSLDEQRTISAFFERLDHLITLHQRKCEQLKKLKKYFLKNMFPAKGKTVPAIRFHGFTGDWEQRKLGGILQEHNVRTSDFTSNPIYSLTIEEGVTPKTDRYERSFLVTKTTDLFKLVRPNEFVTNPMNLRFGALGYNTNSFCVSVSGYYDVFSIDENKCSGFWNSYFKSPIVMKIFNKVATGSLIEKRRVKYSTLQDIILYMPNQMSEKIMVGKYFDSIDHLITLHHHKCDQLQSLKKFMLQNLFI